MENEQQDFVLEMCEQSVVKKPIKHKAKDVKVQHRCKDTVDWVDMLINEGDLRVIHNPISSIGKSWLKEILPDEYIVNQDKHIKFTNGASLTFIGIDEGVDITNDITSLTKGKGSNTKEKQIENNAWNGGKNKRFSGYKSYY